MRFNVAAFYNDLQDAQLVLLSCPQYGGPGPCALPQNAGNAHVYGFEAEIYANLGPLEFDASGSKLHWEWQCVNPQVVGQAQGPCSSDPAVISMLSSNPIGFMPEQFHAGLQYGLQFSGGSTLTPRVDVTYLGPLAGADLAPAPGSPSATYGQIGGYTLTDMRLTWRNAQADLDVTLYASNLTQQVLLLLEVRPDRGGGGHDHGLSGHAADLGTDDQEDLLVK